MPCRRRSSGLRGRRRRGATRPVFALFTKRPIGNTRRVRTKPRYWTVSCRSVPRASASRFVVQPAVDIGPHCPDHGRALIGLMVRKRRYCRHFSGEGIMSRSGRE